MSLVHIQNHKIIFWVPNKKITTVCQRVTSGVSHSTIPITVKMGTTSNFHLLYVLILQIHVASFATSNKSTRACVQGNPISKDDNGAPWSQILCSFNKYYFCSRESFIIRIWRFCFAKKFFIRIMSFRIIQFWPQKDCSK